LETLHVIKDYFGKHNNWTGMYTFNYLGHILANNFNYYIDKIITIFEQVCTTLRIALKWETRKDPQLKFYKFTVHIA
jgi:hypothetical protein